MTIETRLAKLEIRLALLSELLYQQNQYTTSIAKFIISTKFEDFSTSLTSMSQSLSEQLSQINAHLETLPEDATLEREYVNLLQQNQQILHSAITTALAQHLKP
ncbi:hypothetical protein [Glaesserella parasuis]|uniref:hypothetical protein n=1 Tax=Glaesserella parasuis TaxID=738 RepID=UPI001056430E|nr:hypothetical protein [Glaesserella parasuis]